MARPIEPTPTLYGEDARRLLRELKDICSPQEASQRVAQARVELAELMRPKHPPVDERVYTQAQLEAKVQALAEQAGKGSWAELSEAVDAGEFEGTPTELRVKQLRHLIGDQCI